MRRIALVVVLLALSFFPALGRDLPRPRLGFTWGDLTPQNQRLIGAGPNNWFYYVQFVEGGSLAKRAGINTNDLISKVDGVRVTSPDQLDQLVDAAWINDQPNVTITLWRPHLHADPRTGIEQNVVIAFPAPPPAPVAPPPPEFETVLQRCLDTASSLECGAILTHPALKANATRMRRFFADLYEGCGRYERKSCAALLPALGSIAQNNPAYKERAKQGERFFMAFDRCKAGYTDNACETALAAHELPSALREEIVAMQAAKPRNLNDPATLWRTIASLIVIGAALAALAWRLLSMPRSTRPESPSILTTTAPTDPLSWLRSQLDTLIRRFAGTAAPTSPQPIPALRDPDTARAALKLANSYLDEIGAESTIGLPGRDADVRATLALAARQLQIAQAADPSVAYDHTCEDGSVVSIPQARLRAHAVYLEAMTYAESAPKRAIELLRQAITIDPESVAAHAKLGLLHYLACDRSEAIAALEAALRLDPDDIELVKLLDRARNMTPAQILAYKATNAATTTVSAARTTYSWGMFALAAGVLIGGINLAMWAGGGVIEGAALIALFFGLPYLIRFFKLIGG